MNCQHTGCSWERALYSRWCARHTREHNEGELMIRMRAVAEAARPLALSAPEVPTGFDELFPNDNTLVGPWRWTAGDVRALQRLRAAIAAVDVEIEAQREAANVVPLPAPPSCEHCGDPTPHGTRGTDGAVYCSDACAVYVTGHGLVDEWGRP